MGECGCGNFSGDLTFPAPDGDVYVLDVYTGCADCGTPAGVILHRFTRKQAATWGVEGREPLPVSEEGTGVPVMDMEILRRLMAKEVPAASEWKAFKGCPLDDMCRDVIADGLRAHFSDAAWKTYAQWRARREGKP